MALGVLAVIRANQAPYTRCDGTSGRVSAETWSHVRHIYDIDRESREWGVILDPRSDSLEDLRQRLRDEVLADLDGAVLDCAFGVVAMLLLTLHLVDAEEGLEKAREHQQLADRLFFQFQELRESFDPNMFYKHRLLLGFVNNDCAGSRLRFYVYNSTADLTRRRLRTGFGMMAAGAHIHNFLMTSPCLTKEPDAADFFFVPAYHGDQYDEFLEVRAHAPSVLEEFPQLLQKRSMDHVFVVAANLPSWPHLEPFRHATLLTVESYQVNNEVPRWYSPWKDVMIPGYIDRWRIEAMRSFNKPTDKRGYILIFHGHHPGTHHLYVKHGAEVRTKILDSFSGIPDCSVGAHVPDFFDRMGRSHFCLIPRGSSAWTIHLYESFFFGCVPVILSDMLEVPFQSQVDWPSLSIKWPEDRVGPELLDYLRGVPLAKIAEMKKNLEEAACFFDFHRGFGSRRPEDPPGWLFWGDGVVAISGDCDFVMHGDGDSLTSCQESCAQDERCNLINFNTAEEPGRCVLRECQDAAQAALTGGADGWQVFARVSQEEFRCSPYAAIMKELEARARHRPFTHGPHWI